MRTLLILIAFKLVSCTQYHYDVNQLHESLTTFDKISKTVKYCIHMNNKTLDNSYLIGTWYKIYKFAKDAADVGSDYCEANTFTQPSKEDLDGYKAKYNLQNETFSFDNHAVICSTSLRHNRTVKNIVVGDKTAKYFFLNPKSSQRFSGMYEVLTYKSVNNDYLIYYECSMRGRVKYLWSRKKYQTEEELARVIKPLYELEDMGRERFCKKAKVVSTTPYF